MWERLIRRQDRERLGIGFERIESPFFAKSHVHRSLLCQESLTGLDSLKSAFGCHGHTRHDLAESQVRRMLEAVEEGDWLLVLDEPFSPLSRDVSGRWSYITGKRRGESFHHPAPQENPPQPPAEPTEKLQTPAPIEKQLTCTFTKPCKLPDGTIDYTDFGKSIPTSAVGEYGDFVLLGSRETDAAGNLVLKQIRGSAIPPSLGTLLLGGTAAAAAGASCGGLCVAGAAGGTTGTGVVTAGVATGALMGLVALLWPSSLGDSSLYTDEQLKSLKEGRTRVRLHVEQQADGTLKGYGYNTQNRSDWEMIPVVQFQMRGSQQVADFGDGITLIWTPAVDPSSTLGIPPLEGAPQAPQIWIYPPTEQADNTLVNPIYPPEYKDFILVFPAGSGIKPLYIVMNVRLEPGIVTGQGQDVSGTWLAGAGVGLGVSVPTSIADRLRGKSFSTFDAFKSAFWIAVGTDAELAGEFNDSNKARTLGGMAPRARAVDTVGKRRSFELHHVIPVSEGGEVYDVDNLSAMTPKHHINTHRSPK